MNRLPRAPGGTRAAPKRGRSTAAAAAAGRGGSDSEGPPAAKRQRTAPAAAEDTASSAPEDASDDESIQDSDVLSLASRDAGRGTDTSGTAQDSD